MKKLGNKKPEKHFNTMFTILATNRAAIRKSPPSRAFPELMVKIFKQGKFIRKIIKIKNWNDLKIQTKYNNYKTKF